LAIGTAKEIIETTCRTILEERGKPADMDADVGQLVRKTREILDLVPETIPQSSRGINSISRILGSLGGVSQGLAELRNLYGTGHGKHGKSGGPSPRHARLAVGAASTLATFLFETHSERDE